MNNIYSYTIKYILYSAGKTIIFSVLMSTFVFANSLSCNNYEECGSVLRKKYETTLFNIIYSLNGNASKDQVENLKKMANDGFKPAELILIIFSVNKSYAEKDIIEAKDSLRKMAEKGDPTSQCLFALFGGDSWMSSLFEKYVVSAAGNGVPSCIYWSSAYHIDNPGKQLQLNLIAAKKNDLVGQLMMSQRYLDGDGVDIDLNKSYCWSIEVSKTAKQAGNAKLINLQSEMRVDYLSRTGKDPDAILSKEFCGK